MTRPFDPIELVELGYVARAGTRDWLRAMASPIIRCMDAGPAPACAYCLGPDGREETVCWTSGQSGAEALADLRRAFGRGSLAERRALAATLVPGLASWLEVAGRPPDSDVARSGGYVDAPLVVLHSSDRQRAVFQTLCRRPYRIDPSQRALWRKLAVHLGAACRLSGRPASAEAADVESVIAPDGRVVHARGDARSGRARERLRLAVQDVDRARTRRGRSDPHAALDLWRGLFSGRWSLVDHFDSDGRRFLLGRRNHPDSDRSALPLRQRQVLFYVATGWSNKEVGYALGISDTTVAAHLRRALSALGLGSRSEWIRVSAEVTFAALGGAPKPARANAHALSSQPPNIEAEGAQHNRSPVNKLPME